MDKLEAMRVFVAVVEEGSFVEASRVLELSAPAVTRSVARLETALGIPLFHRSTRHVRLTDSGQRYYTDAKSILEQVEEAEAAITGSYSEPSGLLSITAPVLFGQRYIISIIADYIKEYPKVSVNSLFQDRIVNLLEENLDVAIRIGDLADSSLFAAKVGDVRRVVCASPAYLQARGVPQSPEELSQHDIIQSATVEPLTTWAFGDKKVRVSPRYQCNQNAAAVSAAVMGTGLTRLMSYQIADELHSGKLALVLEDFEPASMPVSVVYLEGRKANAKIRSFVDLAVEQLRNNPLLNPPSTPVSLLGHRAHVPRTVL